MRSKTRFIVFDGMDNCGKSQLLRDAYRACPLMTELKFPKTLPSGALLRINTEKDFELLFTMFDHLDRAQTYLLDRFIVSNLVYDKVLRGEETSLSKRYHDEFITRFDVLEIFVTRPHVQAAFIDDRISLTVDQFNAGIDEYKQYGPNFQILTRDEQDRPQHELPIRQLLLDQCVRFALTP